MSIDIAKILRKQKKRRLLGETDGKLDFVLTSLLQDMFQEEISDYLDEVKNNLEKELAALKKQLDYVRMIRQPKDGYSPVKGKDYFDGKNVDKDEIIKNVLSKINIRDGKDADEKRILKKLLEIIKLPENGYSPVKGKDYFDGKDGSPDTPEQIADKINTLEEKIEIKTIKGLKTYFDNIIKKIQDVKSNTSGRGGMGNVTHKTFSVSSATTSSSLDYKVAANGNAIWVRYQGQMLVKDTHYTINGPTITWLETFNDNTFVDVTYIRT